MDEININGKVIGKGKLPYFIAEIGSNHNGDMELCKTMIDAAIECGVDAVKFQSWSKSTLISKSEYSRNTEYSDKKKHFGTLEEMVEKYQFTEEQHKEIYDYCQEKNITFLSTCFSKNEADLLESFNVPLFKIASMDVNNLPLLEHVAKKGKPVILSTGMATLGEIENAIKTLADNGSGPIVLLHCVAIYPPKCETINLKNIVSFGQIFDLPIGFSDHTVGTSIPISAIALGACVIEKHFTIDKELDGWDHAISADPKDMSTIVKDGKEVFLSLGTSRRIVSTDEIEKSKAFRRSAVLTRYMKEGDILSSEDIDFKRPGTGIKPDEFKYLVGRKLKRDIQADMDLAWDDLV